MQSGPMLGKRSKGQIYYLERFARFFYDHGSELLLSASKPSWQTTSIHHRRESALCPPTHKKRPRLCCWIRLAKTRHLSPFLLGPTREREAGCPAKAEGGGELAYTVILSNITVDSRFVRSRPIFRPKRKWAHIGDGSTYIL